MTTPVALSLFSGLGGLDLGARAAGVNVVLATDSDQEALGLLEETQGTATLPGDMRDLLTTGALERSLEGTRPDILFGGPPCTGFSHAGFWLDDKRSGRDPASQLLDTFIEAVRTLRPEAFVLENVPGLKFKTYVRFYESLIARTRRAGYTVTATILDASRFGVPQARRRLFIVGARHGRRIDLDDAAELPERTAGWALSGLEAADNPPERDERPAGAHAHWLDHVPPGENYLCLTAERGHPEGPFKYRGRYWSFLLKAHPDRAAPTVPASRVTYNGPFHWSGRHLRVRELARLQTFPDWQRLSPRLANARRHVGNAVPPLLATAVLWHVCHRLGWLENRDKPPPLRVAEHPDSTYAELSASFGDAGAELPPVRRDVS